MEKRKLLITIGGALGAILLLGGVVYAVYASGRVSVDKADVEAPLISLSPQSSGTLEEIDVHAGDIVPADFVVARVGTELVKTSVAGEIVSVNDQVGKLVNRGEAVVTMINPSDLRVVAQVEENKGLESIRIGQVAHFTVDAFGSKDFVGIVDEIAPTSRASGVAFSISDKRETKSFDVKIRFNTDNYPELKNGMSAKVTILKK